MTGHRAAAFIADALVDIFARHELHISLVMRGITGFGAKQHLRSDRLLTLSEDLPLVSVAVDTRDRVEAVLPEVNALRFDGLVTLERARLLTGRLDAVDLDDDPDEATKLTVYVGRQQRASDRPPIGPSSTCCIATASREPPCCSASTARPTEQDSAPGSSPPTPMSR